MIYIFAIIAIIVVISLISTSGRTAKQIAAAQASAEWENKMVSRVAAYRDFIRREGDEDLKKLSDNELEDMIANAVRGVANDIGYLSSLQSWAFWLTIIPAILGFGFLGKMIVGGSPEGQTAVIILAVSGVCGVIAAYLFSKQVVSWRGNAIERTWEARGWDVSKLIV